LIRVDAVWLVVEPLDMRVGTEAALRRVVAVFGAARPHHAYLFANRRIIAVTRSGRLGISCKALVQDLDGFMNSAWQRLSQ
jgi:hypothetical protein